MPSVSIILFSGDYDRSMAAFGIANAAAGQGQPVSLFFTFWGLSLLRKTNGRAPNLLQRAFKRLMPIGADRVGLSRLNLGGMGPVLLKRLIRARHGQTLADLLRMAIDRQVDLIACEASMNLLGISRDELLDSPRVRVGDVHTFLGVAKEAEICLFV